MQRRLHLHRSFELLDFARPPEPVVKGRAQGNHAAQFHTRLWNRLCHGCSKPQRGPLCGCASARVRSRQTIHAERSAARAAAMRRRIIPAHGKLRLLRRFASLEFAGKFAKRWFFEHNAVLETCNQTSTLLCSCSMEATGTLHETPLVIVPEACQGRSFTAQRDDIPLACSAVNRTISDNDYAAACWVLE